jgi:formylglycine-generating enzyme required for sulfatase activity
MGTPGYAAPEQYGLTQTDVRSDIYSLGVLLHELLTHHDPSATPFNLPPLRALTPRISPELQHVVERATSLDPDHRYASMLELREAVVGCQTPTSCPPAVEASISLPELTVMGIEFVVVPGGRFLMGSNDDDPDAREAESPLHWVHLDTYFISRYPITSAQFRAFSASTGRQSPYDLKIAEVSDHPIIGITWYDAIAFCRWLSRESGWAMRLPSEAEWEKAARGTAGRRFPWGDKWDLQKCWFADEWFEESLPVGLLSPETDSPYGCADMSGNVTEWTRSLWGRVWGEAEFRYPYDATDGRENLEAAGEVLRIVRGAAHSSSEPCFRCAARRFDDPKSAKSHGFRVVTSLASQP